MPTPTPSVVHAVTTAKPALPRLGRLLLAAGLLALSACSSLPLQTPEQIAMARQILSGSWTLTQASAMDDLPDNILLTLYPEGSPASATKVEDVRVSGFSGVNHFSGRATLDWSQQSLRFGPLATTRKMGPEPRMQFENALLKQLDGVHSFRLQSDKLSLQTADGSLVFRKGSQ